MTIFRETFLFSKIFIRLSQYVKDRASRMQSESLP